MDLKEFRSEFLNYVNSKVYGLDDVKEELFNFLVSFLKGEKPQLIIVGRSGTGKSILLHLIYDLLKDYNTNFILCTDFLEDKNLNKFDLNIIDMMSFYKNDYKYLKDVSFISASYNCDKVKHFVNCFPVFKYEVEDDFTLKIMEFIKELKDYDTTKLKEMIKNFNQ